MEIGKGNLFDKLKLFSFILMLVVILVLASAPSHPEIYPPENSFSAYLNDEFQIKVGQEAFISSENIKIKFLDVTEDSRCPIDGQCVWGGQVTVLVNIEKDGQDLDDFSLTLSSLGRNNLPSKNFDGYVIELIKVEPQKTSQSAEPLDYIATLELKSNDKIQTSTVSIGIVNPDRCNTLDGLLPCSEGYCPPCAEPYLKNGNIKILKNGQVIMNSDTTAGLVEFSLSAGTYTADASVPGYTSKEVEFEVADQDVFLEITLEKGKELSNGELSSELDGVFNSIINWFKKLFG